MVNLIQTIKNLTIGFTSQKGEQISILKNISTNIKKGETVGIVGESGSGKSTLALAMMGYVKHGLYTISGECLFHSNNLLEMKNKDLENIRGRKIAMIPQNAGQSLTPNLKIGYQIDEALKLHTDLKKEKRDKKISELLNKVRLPSPEIMAQRYPHELSGGQQQRVAVATATLCCCPPDNSCGYLCAIISGEGNLTLLSNSEIFLSLFSFLRSVCNFKASSI